MCEYVDKLVRLAGLHTTLDSPTAAHWEAVERELATELPADYKALVSGLGNGLFGWTLRLLNPASSDSSFLLSKETLVRERQLIADLENKLGISFFPNPNGWVMIATMDMNDWLVPPKTFKGSSGKLMWLEVDCDRFTILDFTISQFIHDLYLGLIREPWAEGLRASIWPDPSFFMSTSQFRK